MPPEPIDCFGQTRGEIDKRVRAPQPLSEFFPGDELSGSLQQDAIAQPVATSMGRTEFVPCKREARLCARDPFAIRQEPLDTCHLTKAHLCSIRESLCPPSARTAREQHAKNSLGFRGIERPQISLLNRRIRKAFAPDWQQSARRLVDNDAVVGAALGSSPSRRHWELP